MRNRYWRTLEDINEQTLLINCMVFFLTLKGSTLSRIG